MNTPAHLIVNLFVLGRKESPRYQSAMLAGAVLPDVPMFFFYFVEKVVRGVPEYLIWSHDYYLASWQNFIDCFNSIPLIIVGLLISFMGKSRTGQLFFMQHDASCPLWFPGASWWCPPTFFPFLRLAIWKPGFLLGSTALWAHNDWCRNLCGFWFCSFLLFYWSTHLVTKWLVGAVGVTYMVFFGIRLMGLDLNEDRSQ